MNNLRLLAGLLGAALLSGGVRALPQEVMSLEDIFAAAESRSAQLLPMLTAQTEAEREISVARSALLPNINASLSLSYIGDGFTTKRNFSDYQRAKIPHLGTGLGLSVEQPVYTGGAVTAAVDIARIKSTAARYATDFRRDDLRFRLAGFYLDIYKYRGLQKVVEANIEAAHKVLADMTARFEQGTVLRTDITRYELLLSNLELQRTRITNTLTILNDNLTTTAGLPKGTVVIPDSTILERSLPLDGADWWVREAEINSPALSLARSGVDISRKGEALARSERLPKIGLQAGWTIDGPILVEVPPIDRNLSYWYVGVGVSYNISSLYKGNKALAKSRIATRRAIEELEAKRQDVDMAVRADHVRYLEAYEALRTQQKSVELAASNYRTTATRYAAEMALITDMLDAANARLYAEQRLVDARIDIIYYYYKLLFTSGKI